MAADLIGHSLDQGVGVTSNDNFLEEQRSEHSLRFLHTFHAHTRKIVVYGFVVF